MKILEARTNPSLVFCVGLTTIKLRFSSIAVTVAIAISISELRERHAPLKSANGAMKLVYVFTNSSRENYLIAIVVFLEAAGVSATYAAEVAVQNKFALGISHRKDCAGRKKWPKHPGSGLANDGAPSFGKIHLGEMNDNPKNRWAAFGAFR